MSDEKRITVALNTVPGFRAALFHRSLSRFSSAAGILKAGKESLTSVPGVGKALAAAVSSLKAEEAWRHEEEKANQWGVDIVTLFDEGYPEILRQIHDPPPVLYLRGSITAADAHSLAIVGSRAATVYGKATAERFARALAGRGVTVVSGLARGIDTNAHRGALEGGGRTIAVLGSAMDRLYPAENNRLAAEIASSGAVVTEFPFGSGPDMRHFPMRNRTISGLSLGLIVVEAAARSGALITARLAMEQGREVFAVPGNVTSSRSDGPNALLRDGACLVRNVDDVFEELPYLAATERTAGDDGLTALSDDERVILSRLGREPLTVDEVIRQSPVPSSRTVSILTALEVKGLVRQHAGRRFVRH
jgi:DNA processing protein